MNANLSMPNFWDGASWRAHSCGCDAAVAETSWHGWVIPGLVNAHSHAFQRAMAGLAEHRVVRAGDTQDSFWSWRETMYTFAARLDPETLHAVAAQAYVEMLEAGYTQVCEFHYLHHAQDGKPYAPASAMSAALIAAARETGIGLTLLPTLYMSGGFDRRPLAARQQRFA
ncbi:amidohydrolase family protein, partial [Metallibacterium scheffleri]